MQRISDRPQIYEKCLIKDTDIDVVQEQLSQFQIKPRLGARLVMNNRTISVFMKSQVDSAVFSVPLNQVQVMDYKNSEECFKLLDKLNQLHTVVLCPLRSAKQDLMQIKQSWIQDIRFFSLNCFNDLDKAHIHTDFNDPLLDLKQSELDSLRIKNKQLDKQAQSIPPVVDKAELQDQFKNLQSLAIEAITKEMKYEQLIEQEEKQKIKDEKNSLAIKLEQLKNKDECIGNAAEMEQLREETEEKKNSISNQINEIKDQIKNMIMKNRQKKQKQLEKYRKLNEKDKKNLLNQIQEERLKLASDVMKAHRNGDMSKCLTKDVGQQCEYCEKYFKDELEQMIDCKKEDSFCFICCVNEFGDYHIKEKNKCIEACDCDSSKGNWVWVPHDNQVVKL